VCADIDSLFFLEETFSYLKVRETAELNIVKTFYFCNSWKTFEAGYRQAASGEPAGTCI